MAKCILHVGMHKTGTTSIQHSLAELDDEKFYYARIQARPNHSIAISAIFKSGPRSHAARKMARSGMMDAATIAVRARPDLDDSVKIADGRTLVISGERILRMSAAGLRQLQGYLGGHGYDDIDVLAYVRAPVSYIASAVQQKLMTGNLRELKISNSVPAYRKKFEKFDEVFGAAKVRLVKFDPGCFPDRDVVIDFCQRTGIPLASITLIRMNESITRLAAQLRFQYTAHAADEGLKPLRGGAARKLLAKLRELDPTGFRLAPSVIEPYLAAIQADVEWMEKRLGQSLAEPGLKDQDSDIRSIDDLLTPVPGVNEKLRGLLSEAGVDIAPGEAGNTWQLLLQVASIGSTDSGEDSAMAQGKAERRAERLRAAGAGQTKSDVPGDAGLGGGGRGRAGEGRGEGRGGRRRGSEGRDPGLPAERRSKRDARIMALAQAIAAASATREGNERPSARPQPGAGRAGMDQRLGTRQGMGHGRGPGRGPGAGPELGQGKRAGGRQGQDGGAPPARPRWPLQMPQANARPDSQTVNRRNASPLTTAPLPLLNVNKNLAVLWSPKSACTTVYVWFSHISGFSRDVREYASWPHRHRMEQFSKSDIYAESAANGMAGATLLRIIRDPYSRAVSIYRHALKTQFADKDMELYSNGMISAEKGYSFQTFLDMAATLDMRQVDIHFRPQFHLYETQRKPDRVINISKQDLFTELNAFEAEVGITATNFADLDWLHVLESKRKAKQEPMKGDTLDTTAFSRHQVNKLGLFPNYGQLLTPEARQKIELIYKSDFDAYRDYL